VKRNVLKINSFYSLNTKKSSQLHIPMRVLIAFTRDKGRKISCCEFKVMTINKNSRKQEKNQFNRSSMSIARRLISKTKRVNTN